MELYLLGLLIILIGIVISIIYFMSKQIRELKKDLKINILDLKAVQERLQFHENGINNRMAEIINNVQQQYQNNNFSNNEKLEDEIEDELHTLNDENIQELDILNGGDSDSSDSDSDSDSDQKNENIEVLNVDQNNVLLNNLENIYEVTDEEEQQPVEEEQQPVEEKQQPVEEQPVEEQPVEEQPVEEQPVEEEQQPVEEEQQPVEEQPVEEEQTESTNVVKELINEVISNIVDNSKIQENIIKKKRRFKQPIEKANKFDIGYIQISTNDKQEYEVVTNKNGVKRWKRIV